MNLYCIWDAKADEAFRYFFAKGDLSAKRQTALWSLDPASSLHVFGADFHLFHIGSVAELQIHATHTPENLGTALQCLALANEGESINA